MKSIRLVLTACVVLVPNGLVGITFAGETTEAVARDQSKIQSIRLQNYRRMVDEDIVDLNIAAKKYNKKQEKERNKVVCGKEPILGTRIKRKVCRSHAIIKRDERHAKDMLDVNSKR